MVLDNERSIKVWVKLVSLLGRGLKKLAATAASFARSIEVSIRVVLAIGMDLPGGMS